MAIKPIDLQVNMNQMHEVGKGEQARTDALAEQQHVMDKESSKKTLLKNSKLDESNKGEKTEVRDALADDKEKKHGSDGRKRSDEHEQNEGGERTLSHDDRLGKNIDVLK